MKQTEGKFESREIEFVILVENISRGLQSQE